MSKFRIILLATVVTMFCGCASRADVRGYGEACEKHGGLAYVGQIYTIRNAECVDGFVVVPKDKP